MRRINSYSFIRNVLQFHTNIYTALFVGLKYIQFHHIDINQAQLITQHKIFLKNCVSVFLDILLTFYSIYFYLFVFCIIICFVFGYLGNSQNVPVIAKQQYLNHPFGTVHTNVALETRGVTTRRRK